MDWSVVQIQVLSELSSAKEVNLIRYGKDEPVGVRLSHFFCKTSTLGNRSYSRGSYWDDTRLVTMTVPEFQADYFERMIRDAGTRNELWRLHFVREAKKNSEFYHFRTLVRIQPYPYCL